MATKPPSDNVFNNALNALVKQFGTGVANTGLAEINPKAIPTGHDDLDVLLTKGAHGIFLGGIVEIFGSEGSGKTSLALRTVGEAQKQGHHCAWFDCESGFNEGIALLNGVDPTKLILPDLVETSVMKKSDDPDSISIFNVYEVLEMVYKFVISNAFQLVVIDSVAGLMPERILSDDYDPNKSASPAEVARAMSDLLRKIAPACKKTETTLIMINQKRDQPGQYYQNPNHTPGGKAKNFYFHQRISVEKINGEKGQVWAEVEGKKELIGHYAKTKIVKNKHAPPVPPGVEIEIPVYYREYFPDDAEKCYTLARSLQVVKIRNGVLTWKDGDDIILQETGESTFLSSLRSNKMEAQLAAACVVAGDGEANQKKAKPVLVPKTIHDLAGTYKKSKPKTKAKAKGAAAAPAIDL